MLSVPLSAGKSSSSRHQGSLPGAHLAGVDLEPVGNLCGRLLTFQGFQGHLGFEYWAMLLMTLLHLLLLRLSSVILGAGPDLSYLSRIWGPPHSKWLFPGSFLPFSFDTGCPSVTFSWMLAYASDRLKTGNWQKLAPTMLQQKCLQLSILL